MESRLPETRLPAEVETVLYRVVQEALTNVIKHARAKHISVLLHSKPGRVAVVIEDDGRGFPATRPETASACSACASGSPSSAAASSSSRPSAGTTIVVEVPTE